MLEGKHIPENTIIGVNSWVVNRDKAIFGEDADIFRPERWIDSDPKDLTKMRTNMFTVSFLSFFCPSSFPMLRGTRQSCRDRPYTDT